MLFDKKYADAFIGDRYYRGQLDEDGVPSGVGLMCVGEGLIYVGEVVRWERQGRGYMLRLKVTKKEVTRRKTYEEVMETAEFDSCGRPIHYDESPFITEVHTLEEWSIEDDGLWEEDSFRTPLERDFSAYPHMELEAVKFDVFDGKAKYRHYPDTFEIGPNGADDDKDVRITPLPGGRIMVCDSFGAAFALSPGDEYSFDISPDYRMLYTLKVV